MTTIWILISLSGHPVPQFYRHAYATLSACRTVEHVAKARCMAIPVGAR